MYAPMCQRGAMCERGGSYANAETGMISPIVRLRGTHRDRQDDIHSSTGALLKNK
jgi:hypothetical protein